MKTPLMINNLKTREQCLKQAIKDTKPVAAASAGPANHHQPDTCNETIRSQTALAIIWRLGLSTYGRQQADSKQLAAAARGWQAAVSACLQPVLSVALVLGFFGDLTGTAMSIVFLACPFWQQLVDAEHPLHMTQPSGRPPHRSSQQQLPHPDWQQLGKVFSVLPSVFGIDLGACTILNDESSLNTHIASTGGSPIGTGHLLQQAAPARFPAPFPPSHRPLFKTDRGL
jgi:hypothetical protein